jgi:hypothetical protein
MQRESLVPWGAAPFTLNAARKIFMETRHSGRWESDCIETLCQHGYSVIWQAKGDALLSITS